MNTSQSNWLFLTMVLLGLVVVGELYFRAGGGAPSAPVAAGNVGDTEIPTADISLPELASLSDTVARPLFLPNRRMPEEDATLVPEPTQPEATPKANRFALSAIVIVDDVPMALLSDTATGSLSRVRKGEQVSGWKVEEISDDSVVLVNGGNREQLPLRTFGPPPPPSRKQTPRARAAPGTPAVPAPATPQAQPRRPRRPRRGPRATQSDNQKQAY